MRMSRYLRVALGAAAAVTALIASGATAAQATTSSHSASSSHAVAAAASIPTGRHSLATTYSPGSYCLAATGSNSQTDLEFCGYNNTFWYITQLTYTDSRGGAWVKLQNDNGNCLDAETDANGSPNNNGDHVNTFPCNGASQQQWYLWPLAGGHWMIVNGYNTNNVLDARTDSTWNPHMQGDPVQLWAHNGSAEQTWQFIG